MKTNYDTDEDKLFLKKILNLAMSATDKAYQQFAFHQENEIDLTSYILSSLKVRAKVFEYLEEEDPNIRNNEAIIKALNEPKVISATNVT